MVQSGFQRACTVKEAKHVVGTLFVADAIVLLGELAELMVLHYRYTIHTHQAMDLSKHMEPYHRVLVLPSARASGRDSECNKNTKVGALG